MLVFRIIVPTALLIFLWRSRMTGSFTWDDLPAFVFPTVLHLSDITFTLLVGFTETLLIILLASAAQIALLLYAWVINRQPARLAKPVYSAEKINLVL